MFIGTKDIKGRHNRISIAIKETKFLEYLPAILTEYRAL